MMPGKTNPTVHNDEQDDPLAKALAPPENESPEEKVVREEREREALRVSNAIDESIKAERLSEKRRKTVKLLLLGQSESGKSTTLRQFQLQYTPNAFREERLLWRGVIQLNLIRSVLTILDTLSDAQAESLAKAASQQDSQISDDTSSDDPLFFSDDFDLIKARLEPLRHCEDMLIAKLAPRDEHQLANPAKVGGFGKRRGAARQEPWVRSSAIPRLKQAIGAAKRPQTAGEASLDDWDGPTEVIFQCREEMLALWDDPMVREVLRRRKVRIEESPGFFLDDLERLCSPRYMPSDDDILRARLKTVGVTETVFEMETAAGRDSGSEWRIYDVGGSRSQRPKWVPFFDDVDAIIFLAPISAFDQALAEDHSVNRLEDSVLLWKQICSNPLLAKVDLILFLNKCDILAAKLEAGVRLSKYVRSFGERSNDVETASKYFKSKFQAIQREYSPELRRFYGYCTSVTDRETTRGILTSVRDMIVREHLRKSRLI